MATVINTTFDAMYTAVGKDFAEARSKKLADSVDASSGNYDITMYGTFTMTRVYMEFDLDSVKVPITSIDLYLYINSSDKGQMTVVYCGQGNLQDESDYPLYIDSQVSLVVSNLNTDTGLNVLSLDLSTFPYSKNQGSIIFALLTDNDFEDSTGSTRSINLDSSNGTNPPYIIVNDSPPPPQTGWTGKVKGIDSTNASNISGVAISNIRGLNGVFNG